MPEEIISVMGIVEKNFKTGHSEKTGKDWVIHKYKASNGVEFTSFDDLEIGDVVKLTKNGDYWNGAKPRVSDTQHDEVMTALREIYKLLKDR